MSDYAIRAWRDTRGNAGFTIGYVYPAGLDNHVIEIELDASELPVLVERATRAIARAQAATEGFYEPMPGAYESWDGKEEL